MGGLILYDLVSHQRRDLKTVNLYDSACRGVMFSPGGRYVAANLNSGTSAFVIVWDTQNGRRWRTFDGANDPPAMAFRGETLALAVGRGQIDLYEPDRGEDPVTTYTVPGQPCAMQFRGDGAALAVACQSKGLIVLETSTGRILRSVGPPDNREVGLCRPNADWSMIAGGADGGIRFWESGLT